MLDFRLKPDANALLVHAYLNHGATWQSMQDLGVNRKRYLRTLRPRLTALKLIEHEVLTDMGQQYAHALHEAMQRSMKQVSDNVQREVSLGDVLVTMARTGARPAARAEYPSPNARDFCSAAVIDVAQRLERGRRQRVSLQRCQLREARWLLKRAYDVLNGLVCEENYLSPTRGHHKRDPFGIHREGPPAAMKSERGAAGTRRLYGLGNDQSDASRVDRS